MGKVSHNQALSTVLACLAPSLRRILSEADEALNTSEAIQTSETPAAWEEIRVTVGQPFCVVTAGEDRFIAPDGRMTGDPTRAYRVTAEDVHRTVELMSGSSLYAWETELRQGFLTLPGGHRVGLCGRAVLRDGRVFTLRDITSLNVRLARELPGAADRVLPWILDAEGLPYSTLVFSPPGAGKTTLLRDLIRQISHGRPDLGLPGWRVAVADERSELAGVCRGAPRLDLGPRCDVLDGCPKAVAMEMLLRAMGPRVVATDEIGRPEDGRAVGEALRCGVRVLATAHAGSVAELADRPLFREWIGAFGRLVRLGRGRGPGTVEEVWEGAKGRLLFPERRGPQGADGHGRALSLLAVGCARAGPDEG